MGDARDIMGLDSKDSPNKPHKKGKKLAEGTYKRPEGMHRELYALLQSDYRDPPSLAPTDTGSGYKQPKAKIGRSKVRQWKWMEFSNSARNDDLVLHHWRRKVDEGKEYPFAEFGKANNDVTYTDEEYNLYLHDESGKWSRAESDYLFDLSRRFDQRFAVITDRYDDNQCPNRTMEDLKDRYYSVVTKLIKARTPAGQDVKDLPPTYDCEHEKHRKEQLNKLFNRTPEQVEEEEMLVAELKKIEIRKKERDKKSQDINKLITATESKPISISSNNINKTNDHNNVLSIETSDAQQIANRKDKKLGKKLKKRKSDGGVEQKPIKDQQGIKFPEIKGAGIFLRSSKLKMPPSVGNKKTRAVEQLLEELSVDIIPMPTEDICQSFNDLRNQLLLLYELKQAMGNCEYELQTLRHRYELMCPGKQVSDLIGFSLDPPEELNETSTSSVPATSSATPQLLIDSVAPLAVVGSRKRRTAAALLENNPWKKNKITK